MIQLKRLIQPSKADTAKKADTAIQSSYSYDVLHCCHFPSSLRLGSFGFKHMVKVNVSASSAERSGNNAVHSSWLIQPKRLIQPYKADTAKKADTAVHTVGPVRFSLTTSFQHMAKAVREIRSLSKHVPYFYP